MSTRPLTVGDRLPRTGDVLTSYSGVQYTVSGWFDGYARLEDSDIKLDPQSFFLDRWKYVNRADGGSTTITVEDEPK